MLTANQETSMLPSFRLFRSFRSFRSSGALAPALALLAAVSSSCTIADYESRRTVERQEAATGITGIECASHNGSIEIVGVPDAAGISIRAELLARGNSPEEADTHVRQLDLAIERKGDRLLVKGVKPIGMPSYASPSFAFALQVPQALAAELTTHNGDVRVRSVDGGLVATTHNGRIEAKTAAREVQIETHNGSVEVSFAGDGAASGSIVTHNGSVRVAMGGRAAAIDATTANGSVATEALAASVTGSRTSKKIVVGDGGGALTIRTHNGSVLLRN